MKTLCGRWTISQADNIINRNLIGNHFQTSMPTFCQKTTQDQNQVKRLRELHAHLLHETQQPHNKRYWWPSHGQVIQAWMVIRNAAQKAIIQFLPHLLRWRFTSEWEIITSRSHIEERPETKSYIKSSLSLPNVACCEQSVSHSGDSIQFTCRGLTIVLNLYTCTAWLWHVWAHKTCMNFCTDELEG
jgi:hypothetical protein